MHGWSTESYSLRSPDLSVFIKIWKSSEKKCKKQCKIIPVSINGGRGVTLFWFLSVHMSEYSDYSHLVLCHIVKHNTWNV